MNQAFEWIWEVVKVTLLLFTALFLYSIVNALLLEWAGGFEQLEESGLFTLFFLLQTGGILALVTVFYRNKLKKNAKLKLPEQEPLSSKWVRILLSIGFAAIAASYIILFIIIWS